MFDLEAVIWRPEPNQIQTLPVFPGDSVAAALAINDMGQARYTSAARGQSLFLGPFMVQQLLLRVRNRGFVAIRAA